MKRDSVNDTCYTCHMEKRGPFVHVHEPVAEDCSNCHNPHGTTAENLLKARPPFLCHQCHTPHGAQVAQLTGSGNLGPSQWRHGKSGISTRWLGVANRRTQVHGPTIQYGQPTPQFNFR
jgi:predicted CXXCH cytochrome family protein